MADSPVSLASWLLDHGDGDDQPAAAIVSALYGTHEHLTRDGQQRRYQLTGLVFCRICGRRAEAHWVHGRPGYRCRHGRTSASPPMPGRPKPLYLREDVIVAAVLRNIDGKPDSAAAAVYLRTNRLTVTCDRTTITVTGEPPTGCPQQRPPPEPLET
jgi:site-specific DNA recombinase